MAFKKNHTPWNKGTEGIMKAWNKGTKGIMKSNKMSFKKGSPPPEHKRKCECFRCTKIPYNKGIKRPELSGKNHHNWKGGKYIDSNGYVLVLTKNHPRPTHPNGYMFEHRLVVEEQIGRYLLTEEIAHHIGKKDDNRPSMLMAFTSHSAHMRFHKNPNNVKQNEIIFDGRKLLRLKTSNINRTGI